MLKAILFLSTRLELPASYRATKDIDVDHELWRNMETHIFPSNGLLTSLNFLTQTNMYSVYIAFFPGKNI